jgi:uncharacterized protein YdhG (YjbR/CyaY superfamily)
MEKIKYTCVDQYIESFDGIVQEKMIILRDFIKGLIPEAEECISYNMPAYKINGVLVYFAGYKKHIGFYPTGDGIKHFEPKLSNFKYSTGAIQFPLDNELPFSLIEEIVLYRKSKTIK